MKNAIITAAWLAALGVALVWCAVATAWRETA